LGYTTPQHWYNISFEQIKCYGGAWMLQKHFSSSPIRFVTSQLPNHCWEVWRFKHLPLFFWREITNQKQVLSSLQKSLSFTTPESIYSLTIGAIQGDFRSLWNLISSQYSSSLSLFISTILIEFNWFPWLFTVKPVKIWDDFKERRNYFEWLGDVLGYDSLEDWYSITKRKIKQNCGDGLLVIYRYSPYRFVSAMTPDHQWFPWKFVKVEKRFWGKRKHCQAFFEWLKVEVNIVVPEMWYSINSKTVCELGGSSLLRSYTHSLSHFISSYLPEFYFYPWCFVNYSKEIWKDKKIRRAYFEWLGGELGFRMEEDWCKLTKKDMVERNGSSLLLYYNRSIFKFVSEHIGENHLREWNFHLPKNYWKNEKNQKRFIKWLKEDLAIDESEQWFSIRYKDVIERGRGLVLHHGSFLSLLNKWIPETRGQPWRFKNFKPKKMWNNLNVTNFLEEFEKKRNIRHVKEWKNVPIRYLRTEGGGKLSSSSLREYLQSKDPNFLISKKETQMKWKRAIKNYFSLPTLSDIQEDEQYFSHGIEIDLFLQNIALGFECQGKQHYDPISFAEENIHDRQQFDPFKGRICHIHGVTLIELPFWIKETELEVERYTRRIRPDLV